MACMGIVEGTSKYKAVYGKKNNAQPNCKICKDLQLSDLPRVWVNSFCVSTLMTKAVYV